MFWAIFVKKSFFFMAKKNFDGNFLVEITKKNDFLTKMVKNIVFFTNIGIFCSNFVISML